MSSAAAPPAREAGPWVLSREIGSGSFAKVWQATHKTTRQVAAVKEINLDRLSKKLQESLASEVAVLRHTQHHNIVCLLDLIKDGNRLFLVLEYCAGGDLSHYLRRYRQVSEATARYFLQQVAEGLKELRRHNVIHRDLKPQNLLLSDVSSAPLVKIADFGFARSLAPQGLAETLCGSPLYMAPEILQFQKYDAKADLWSIGTILYELLVGKPPYNGANHIQLLRNIEAHEARLPDHIAARLSPACRGLLGRLLQRNPVERITFEEFFSHPFLAAAGAAAGAAGGGEGGVQQQQQHPGPCTSIPPAQPVHAASTAAAGAALPAAMRQAAAAAAAATTGDRGGSSAAPKPHLHLMSVQKQKQLEQAPAAAGAALGPQQQPQRQTPLHQQQQQQYLQLQHQQQLQQQQQYVAGLVSQPVSQHPLAPAGRPQPPPGDTADALMSDSMEGDFVVVYTPNSSAASHTTHNTRSNSSSKASSGLADPKAAAVLQGTPQAALLAGARRTNPWQAEQQQSAVPAMLQQQQQAGGYGGGGGVGMLVPHQQHQGLIQVSSSPQQWPVAGGQQAATGVGAGGASVLGMTMQHSSLQLPATPLQRVQLLVQVVRGCVSLLSRHSSSGGGAGGGLSSREAAGRSLSLQQAEQLALLLLALQVVQLLCCPPGQGNKQRDEEQGCDAAAAQADDDEAGADLAAVLAAASQSDVEQLMAAVVDLIKLADTHTAALADQQQQQGSSPTGGGTLHSVAAGRPDGSCAYQTQPHPSTPHNWDGGDHASALVSSLLAVPLPDPAGVLYHAALDSCKAAAVEEVMGNWQAALDGYSLAADLLLFLGQQWPELPPPADPGLQPQEQAALHRLYAAVSTRLTAVVAEAPPLALAC